MSTKIKNVIIILVLLQLIKSTVSWHGFGEHCDDIEADVITTTTNRSDSSVCNSESGLSCINNLCICMPPLIYQSSKKRCEFKLGDKCINETFAKFCPEGSACITSGRRLKQQAINSESEPRCRCLHGRAYAHIDSDMYCKPYRDFGDACDAVNPCDESARVTCINGKCQCILGEDNMYFDHGAQRCVSYLGKECLFSSCQDRAKCVSKRHGNNNCLYFDDENCGKGGEVCECDSGFTATENQTCLPTYGMTCDSKFLRCNPEEFLDCLDSTCLCQMPLHQIYINHSSSSVQIDSDIQFSSLCTSLEGGPCSNSNNNNISSNTMITHSKFRGPPCIKNSICVNESCQCLPGFSSTPDRHCLIDYGHTCGVHRDDDCNHFNGLGCKNGTCQCFESALVYDNVSQTCYQNKIGAPCGEFKVQKHHYRHRSGSSENEAQRLMIIQTYFVGCSAYASCVQDPRGGADARTCIN